MTVHAENMVTVDGAAIRERREALGLTQMAVAKLAGISRTAFCYIERGHRPILRRTASKIEDALSRAEARPMDREAIPQRPGLYYVPSDMSAAYLLTPSDGKVPDLPLVERAVLVALLRYVLGEYEGGGS